MAIKETNDLRYPVSALICYDFNNLFFLSLFRERGEAEREGERETQAGSVLEFPNREIVT